MLKNTIWKTYAVGLILFLSIFVCFSESKANQDNSGSLSIEQLCDRYQLICIAEVGYSDLQKKFWSGFAMSTSSVEFKILEVLKGDYHETTLRIDEVIGSPNKRVTQNASLSPEFFRPGTKVLLCLHYDPMTKKYWDDQNDESMQLYTPELEQQFRRVLGNCVDRNLDLNNHGDKFQKSSVLKPQF